MPGDMHRNMLKRTVRSEPDKNQVKAEKERIYAPLHNRPSDSIGWKELNMGISKIMKNYCGEIKHDELLKIGLKQLENYENLIASGTFAYNPHELMRLLEVFDILTVSEIILNSCLRRKSSLKALRFLKYNSSDNVDLRKLITVRQVNNEVVSGELDVDFFGDLNENYEKHNEKYVREKN